MVNEIGTASNLRLENHLSELTSLVRQLVVGQHQSNMASKVCGICTSVEHSTDLCPTLQKIESDQPENVGATISARKLESAEELLKMFRKVKINIPLLDTIKQIPKYAKFLKELYVHKRKKMKGSLEVGGIVSTLTKNEEVTAGAQALSKKC
ncbi:hypothetical protein CR513_47487, partial [Mucuna pruriens]